MYFLRLSLGVSNVFSFLSFRFSPVFQSFLVDLGAQCKKPLSGAHFSEHEGSVYCEVCNSTSVQHE